MKTCPLCDRLVPENQESRHHIYPKNCKLSKKIPKSKRFQCETLHDVCHKYLHSVFTNKELVRTYNTITKIKKHDKIQSFISWIKNKPIEFNADFKISNNKKEKTKYSR